jgi:signal transduction histidine kinase
MSELQAQVVVVALCSAVLGVAAALRTTGHRTARLGPRHLATGPGVAEPRARASTASAKPACPPLPASAAEASIASAFTEAMGAINRELFRGMADAGHARAGCLNDTLRHAGQLAALGTITAGVAHELRNPLAALQGLAELLGRDFSGDDPRRAYVRTMLESIDKLNRMVEDVLLLSSPAAPAPEVFELGSQVADAVTMARLGLGERSISLTFTNAAPGETPVNGSPARISQALTNILLNAVEATPDGGEVAVTAGRSGAEAVVRVHNTGSYISPEQVASVWLPFYTTKPRGTGLGLAIARQIVAAHGGRIELESHRDTGTLFVMRLPLSAGKAAVTEPLTGRPLPVDSVEH